jgi:predicted SprT family Zn-dependent metalloprotease
MKSIIGYKQDEAFKSQIWDLFRKVEDKLRSTTYGTPEVMQRLDEVTVEINPRMRSTGGKANYANNVVELNYRLLANNMAELEQTFVHELAHLISVYLFGTLGRGHGRRWQSVMNKLGYAPDRCHSLDTSHLKHNRRKFTYTCGCTTFKLGVVRHRKIEKGSKYFCRKCSKTLTYVEAVST